MATQAVRMDPKNPQRDRSDSLQKMLELEHIRKLERLQGHRSMPTPAHASQQALHKVLQQKIDQSRPARSPAKLKPFPTVSPTPPANPVAPLQSRRRDSFAQLPTKSSELPPSAMKAARRTTAIPSLFISVPPPAATKHQIDRGPENHASDEQKHKTVTFLDVEKAEEIASDDASSICHSPSWEAFGQNKKKEKKNEAKMRKKEREQAEKEAKSAKKKLAAKLSKGPPAVKESLSRPPNASRSMSNPMVFAEDRLRPASSQAFYEPPPPIRPQHVRQRSDSVAMQLKAAITGQKTPTRHHVNEEPSFIGGLKLERERKAAASASFRKPVPPASTMTQRSHSFGPEVRVTVASFTSPALIRSSSDGPAADGNQHQQDRSLRPNMPQSPAAQPWSQPLVSPTAPPLPDVSKLQQWKDIEAQQTNTIDIEELEIHNGLSDIIVEQERGRRRESYVHQSRQQSRERSVNGYKDEVRVSSARSHYPPQANRQHPSRACSSSSESSALAVNFTPRNGSLSNLHAYMDRQSQGDDFLTTFRLPYTPPVQGSPRQGSFDRSVSQGPPTPTLLSTEIPLPPESSLSHERLPQTPGAAMRSFKDAARAVFHKVSASGSSKPPVSNYFTQRARDITMTPESSSSRYSSMENLPMPQPVRPFAEPAESKMESRNSSTRPTNRSSLSSSDGLIPSPSPATTPDSSRPQSEKGMPPVDGEVGRVDSETVVVDDDERSYRLSHKGSMLTSSPIVANPRISLPPQIPVQNHEAHLSELEALVSETFGRKASVADAEDSDSSEGYPTPTHTDNSKASTLASPITSTTFLNLQDYGQKPQDDVAEEVKRVEAETQSTIQRHPSLSKSRSSPDLALDTSFLPKLKHQPFLPRPLVPNPPPRSPKRGSVNVTAKPVVQISVAASRKSIVSPKAPSSPSNYLEEARKSISIPPRSNRVSRASIVPPNGNVEPVAKMLVECCNCKFLHDMPSKVYECMASPDGMVEDHRLGVSGVISTTVKCPWCPHGMTTKCCAGYAAVVYLKEKLH
ncbi:hypothetical protein CCHL11_06910 [Colletotrichum chlorophyti]|uniref:Uncharacterized protein n=1 Tax=Colletotrichum chlorophyti TaxID=708187 RepID=A0A1Q8RBG2_9PEZI|nr:hypothetical protein CCHL11_06910 [Colletotrichum chlorophyti]